MRLPPLLLALLALAPWSGLAQWAGKNVDATGMSEGYATALIKKNLLDKYGDAMVRPGRAMVEWTGEKKEPGQCAGQQDIVEVQLTIQRYAELDQQKQAFSFDGYLDAYWYDPRLNFSGNASACAEPLIFGEDEIRQVWQPQFYCNESARGSKP